MSTEHNVPGQLNAYVLDVDSHATSYGKHNRLITMLEGEEDRQEIVIREDIHGLPLSTEADRQRVASHHLERLHPKSSKLVFVRSIPYETDFGKAIEHRYKIVSESKSQVHAPEEKEYIRIRLAPMTFNSISNSINGASNALYAVFEKKEGEDELDPWRFITDDQFENARMDLSEAISELDRLLARVNDKQVESLKARLEKHDISNL